MASEPIWSYDLTNTTDGHNKYWKARVDGSTALVEYGRIGTRGTTQVKAFATWSDAFKNITERAKEKLSNGYKHKTQYTAAPPAPPRPSMSGPERTVWLSTLKKSPTPYVQPVEYRATAPAAAIPAVGPQLPQFKATELDKMPDSYFRDLSWRVAMEEARRKQERDRDLLVKQAARTNDYITAFQNFLLGCAHAMACRAALRWSAGHKPLGSKPMHGLPWNAYDGTKLQQMITGGPLSGRQHVVGLSVRSNPLSWTTAGDIRHYLHPLHSWNSVGLREKYGVLPAEYMY